ncbi:sensor histidine kinase [Streptomyces sp. NBC_01465]|uniref:sensor histidine kinase n=1 Tax=Streptomyces sp. NBC_01465 TaxID=2903878 RepID=UPI002E34B5F6|nr:HAMP domain-containing sensor histidine kinase [Streptomyces sp. NBC_01465]
MSPGAPRRRHLHSLRGKLTLATVLLLAIGIVTATAISLMGMRHYLIDASDTNLRNSRNSLRSMNLSLQQIENLTALAVVRDQFTGANSKAGILPRPESLFVPLDKDGRALSVGTVTPTARQQSLARAVHDPAAVAASDSIHDISLDGDPYRMTGVRLKDGTVVILATSTKAVHDSIKKALKLDLAVGTGLLVMLAFFTMWGARQRLRPLEDMVETASAIADGDLTRRVPPRAGMVTEVDQLRVALNTMLQQVEKAYGTRERSAAQLRRFVADASHELRTPLSAIRGYLQLYDKGMLREPADRTRALQRMNAEADRMGRLVDELLTLARLDQRPELRLRQVDLSLLVRDAAEDLRAQQPERPVEVAADGSMFVHADESGLRQLVGNLLANIRAHTPPQAAVRVELERADGVVRLRVADQGPGMGPGDADRIFDRFFRAGGGAGSGLGMAIVLAVTDAHGGGVDVETAPGAGLAVTVSLPVRAPAAVNA